jgi:hypothetical protein
MKTMTALTNEELTRRLINLESIETIKRLKYRYFRAMDSGDFATLEDLYTDDVEVDYIGGSYHWLMQGKQKLLDAQAASFNSEAIGCHNGHHPEIDILDEDHATGIWYLTDIFMNFRNSTVVYGSAIYRDKYVRLNGQWKIERTSYKRVYEQCEPFTTPPNIVFAMLREKVENPTEWNAWWDKFKAS